VENPKDATVEMTKNTKKIGKGLPKSKKKSPRAAPVILGLKDAKQAILMLEIKILMINHKVVIGGSSLESPSKMLLRKKKRQKKEQLLRNLVRAGKPGIGKGLIPGKEESLKLIDLRQGLKVNIRMGKDSTILGDAGLAGTGGIQGKKVKRARRRRSLMTRAGRSSKIIS
jgi:hypothetical protein